MRRFGNVFRQNRIDREIDEELASHFEDAVEQGCSEDEARRTLGSPLRYREQSRDIKLLPWLESITADIVFGWRQLNKHRAVSAAAILSLALATGATTGAFRLVNAVLLRTLPVSEPQRLNYLAINEINPRDHKPDYRDDFDYPTYRKYAKILDGRADLMVVGMSAPQLALLHGDQPEHIHRQHLSGNVFGIFGLRPAAGRLLTSSDDDVPGAHAVAVLSYDSWQRRFGCDPSVIGKKFRVGGGIYEIVGVGPKGFTGTEPGIVTDLFVPATMNVAALDSPGCRGSASGCAPDRVSRANRSCSPCRRPWSRRCAIRFRRSSRICPSRRRTLTARSPSNCCRRRSGRRSCRRSTAGRC
jgi:hypothetical protein